MKTYILLALLFLACGVQAQTYRAYIKAAETERADGDHYAAMTYYGEALEIEPEAWPTWYHFAESAREFMAYDRASQAYARVRFSPDSSAFPLAVYYQALMEKRMGDYEEAELLLNNFLETGTPPAEFADRARRELEAIGYAVELSNEIDTKVFVEKLPAKFATPYSEFGPHRRGNKFYYSSFAYEQNEGKVQPERLFSKVLVSEDDQKGRPWSALNDSLRHTAHTAFSSDGKTVYYSLCNYTGPTEISCELYRRKLADDGSLGAPERLPDAINAPNSTNTEPSIGRDERSGNDLLFFVSDRKSGRGGLDVYYSVINRGVIGAPVNAGAINTEADEVTPYFNGGTNTLYFSSDRLEGLGGFDVFRAERTGSTFGEAINLGPPVNTSYHENYYVLNEDEVSGYFSSNRPKSKKLDPQSGACCYDLYSFFTSETSLLARIFDRKTELPLMEATLRVSEIRPDGSVDVVYEREGGQTNEFEVPLLRGRNYQIDILRNDFLPLTESLDLSVAGTVLTNQIERDFFLDERPPEQIEYIGLTYDLDTKKPLKGVTERYFVGGEEISMRRNQQDNRFPHTFERDGQYMMIFSKPGWFEDTIVYDMTTIVDPPWTWNDTIYLEEKDITEFPPLTLYFDNAQPQPRDASKTYEEIYQVYYGRKNDFLSEYSAVMDAKNNNAKRNRRIMNLFFEREIRDSYEELDFLTNKILKELQAGTRVKLTLKGYTSPLGNAAYNEALSARRIETVYNYLRRYQGGAYNQFLTNGGLVVVEEPYGESQASSTVSDALGDEGESIYGIGASRERRVEIIGVDRLSE